MDLGTRQNAHEVIFGGSETTARDAMARLKDNQGVTDGTFPH